MSSSEAPVARPPHEDDPRYAGRPLLRLLDCYVLGLTGHLAPLAEEQVAALVRARLGGGPDWKATLRRGVNLPSDIDERIGSLWAQQPPGADPLEFALRVSDVNFVPLIDRE